MGSWVEPGAWAKILAASGRVDFRVDVSGPRAGDPAQIIASSERARAVLGWRPQRDDLATIVGHALAWERKLMLRNRQ